LLFLAKGSVNCNGQDFPKHSAFEFDAHEGPVAIKANEPVEFLTIHLPKFSVKRAGLS
jgi:hypothetical protein